MTWIYKQRWIAVYLVGIILGSRYAACDLNTLIGIRGKDFVVVGSDTAFFRGLTVMGSKAIKVKQLDRYLSIGASGDTGDVDLLTRHLEGVIMERRLRDPAPTPPRTLASIARRIISSSLRRRPLQVWLLVAGWEKESKGATGVPLLAWIDATGALKEVPFGAHGHAAKFVMSVLDQYCGRGRTVENVEDAVRAVRACISQMSRRYIVGSQGFKLIIVDRNGCQQLNLDEKQPVE